METETVPNAEAGKSAGKKPRRALIIVLITLAVLVLVVGLTLLGGRLYFRLVVGDYYAASEPAFEIPGLASGFVPQGLAYDAESRGYFVGGYMNRSGAASPVFAVDAGTGEIRAWATLATEDGEAWTGHAGGLAVWADNVYVAAGGGLDLFDREAILAVHEGEPVQRLGHLDVRLSEGDPLRVAWVDIKEDEDGALLTVGEFYRDPGYLTPDTHKFEGPSGERLQALAVTYRLSEDGLSLTPVRAWALPDLVQGCTFHDGKIWLSTSWGVSFSHIAAYDLAVLEDPSRLGAIATLAVDGADVPLYALDSAARTLDYKIAPMAEENVFVNGKLLTMCESASRKYYFGLLTGGQWCYATDLGKMTPQK